MFTTHPSETDPLHTPEEAPRRPAPKLEPAQNEPLQSLARALVGIIDMKEAQRALRKAMHSEALIRSRGSRRAAAKLLGVDRRYVQRLAENS